jgi:hypothetical protein
MVPMDFIRQAVPPSWMPRAACRYVLPPHKYFATQDENAMPDAGNRTDVCLPPDSRLQTFSPVLLAFFVDPRLP